MKKILNIAGYKFIALSEINNLREKIRATCLSLALKGTILLSSEGINIMLAGEIVAVENFIQWLAQDGNFSNIEYKKSYSDLQPFKKMLIKIKKQIITFAADLKPNELNAPRISPQEFKQWLDDNKDMHVLDVRNQCEIEYGTFTKATHLGLNNFRSFPKAIKPQEQQLKQKPLVMFCTGGIRCEKAAAYLLKQGFSEVYQLHGGILQYFADCGAAHYQGECFVFDDRVTLNAELQSSTESA